MADVTRLASLEVDLDAGGFVSGSDQVAAANKKMADSAKTAGDALDQGGKQATASVGKWDTLRQSASLLGAAHDEAGKRIADFREMLRLSTDAVTGNIEGMARAGLMLSNAMGGLSAVVPVAALAAVSAVLLTAVNNAAAAEREIAAFNATLRAVGPGAQTTGAQLEQISLGFQKLGLSAKEATTLVQDALRGGLTGAGAQQAGTIALNLSAAFGGAAEGWVKQISGLVEGGFPAVQKLNDQIHFLDITEQDNIRTMFQSGDAVGAVTRALNDLAKLYGGDPKKNLSDFDKATLSLTNSWRGLTTELGKVIGIPLITTLTEFLQALSNPQTVSNMVALGSSFGLVSNFGYNLGTQIGQSLTKGGGGQSVTVPIPSTNQAGVEVPIPSTQALVNDTKAVEDRADAQNNLDKIIQDSTYVSSGYAQSLQEGITRENEVSLAADKAADAHHALGTAIATLIQQVTSFVAAADQQIAAMNRMVVSSGQLADAATKGAGAVRAVQDQMRVSAVAQPFLDKLTEINTALGGQVDATQKASLEEQRANVTRQMNAEVTGQQTVNQNNLNQSANTYIQTTERATQREQLLAGLRGQSVSQQNAAKAAFDANTQAMNLFNDKTSPEYQAFLTKVTPLLKQQYDAQAQVTQAHGRQKETVEQLLAVTQAYSRSLAEGLAAEAQAKAATDNSSMSLKNKTTAYRELIQQSATYAVTLAKETAKDVEAAAAAKEVAEASKQGPGAAAAARNKAAIEIANAPTQAQIAALQQGVQGPQTSSQIQALQTIAATDAAAKMAKAQSDLEANANLANSSIQRQIDLLKVENDHAGDSVEVRNRAIGDQKSLNELMEAGFTESTPGFAQELAARKEINQTLADQISLQQRNKEAQQAVNQVTSQFVSFGESAFDTLTSKTGTWHDKLMTILDDFTKLIEKMLIWQPLEAALEGKGNIYGGGSGGGLLGGLFGSASGAVAGQSVSFGSSAVSGIAAEAFLAAARGGVAANGNFYKFAGGSIFTSPPFFVTHLYPATSWAL